MRDVTLMHPNAVSHCWASLILCAARALQDKKMKGDREHKDMGSFSCTKLERDFCWIISSVLTVGIKSDPAFSEPELLKQKESIVALIGPCVFCNLYDNFNGRRKEKFSRISKLLFI